MPNSGMLSLQTEQHCSVFSRWGCTRTPWLRLCA